MRVHLAVISVLCANLVSCAGVINWQTRQRAPTHQLARDVVVYVTVSPLVASVDDAGNVSAVVDGLESELVEEGKRVSIVVARLDEPAPVPRIELQFQLADGGYPEMRGAGQVANLVGTPVGVGVVTVGDSSEVVVDVYAVSASGPVTFTGRISATNWGSTSGYDTAASERAGRAIGRELVR